MRQIQIKASSYGMPGRVVAVEAGQVVWAGPIKDLGDARDFDTLFIHEDDEERLSSLVRAWGHRLFAGKAAQPAAN